MYKMRILSIVFLLALSFVFSSCGVKERITLNEDLHNVIEYVYKEDNIDGICYQDSIYYIDKFNIIKVTNDDWYINDGDVMLSWNGPRMGYLDVFYSYTDDSPIFIYETSQDNVFIHEKYDYMSDIFSIDGTNIEVLFSNIFKDFSKPFSKPFDFNDNISIKLHSKNHTRVATTLEADFEQGVWYISFFGTETVWECSDSFVEMLSENELIRRTGDGSLC